MKNTILSRQYLESVSTADLIAIADDYGIDIPDNLNRRFIIGELLELAENQKEEKKSDDLLLEQNVLEEQELPSTYNDTTISLFLRNPAWLFAYWDIKESEVTSLKRNPDFENLILHVSFYNNENDEKPTDTFDVKVQLDQRELNVLLPVKKPYLMVSLAYSLKSEAPKVLTFSKRIAVPQERSDIREVQPGKKFDMSQLTELSGMKELLHAHYISHRQSFTD